MSGHNGRTWCIVTSIATDIADVLLTIIDFVVAFPCVQFLSAPTAIIGFASSGYYRQVCGAPPSTAEIEIKPNGVAL